jgi:hypothetical protein
VKRPLLVGLIVSAGVHAVVLAALLGSRASTPSPSPMRVRVLGSRAEATPAAGEPASPVASQRSTTVAAPSAARSTPASPLPARPTAERSRAVTSTRAPEGSTSATSGPVPTPTPTAERAAAAGDRPQDPRDASRPVVQDDIWLLTDEAPAEGVPGPAAPGAPGGPGVAPGPRGALSPEPSPGTGGSGAPSLLGELNRRLAWSAARCTPSGAVRSSRGSSPEVPLHFCLDASGRPSAVGLEGTTGSELLDRAARECVVPGAAPLPPLPGCYTVAVRFPVSP